MTELIWDGEKPIRELINDLIDLEVRGYDTVTLTINETTVDLETEDGSFDYVSIPTLQIK